MGKEPLGLLALLSIPNPGSLTAVLIFPTDILGFVADQVADYNETLRYDRRGYEQELRISLPTVLLLVKTQHHHVPCKRRLELSSQTHEQPAVIAANRGR